MGDLRLTRRGRIAAAVAASVVLAAIVVALPSGGDGGARPEEPVALPLRQAVGQRMVYAYAGLQPPAALRERIRRGEAAGVILFSRNVGSRAQVRRTIASLQAIEQPDAVDQPLLVMVDQEGGLVRRIPGAPVPSAAATPSAEAAGANGRAAGANLRGAGVNVDLAPVVDVGRPGAALARTDRLYGRSVSTVDSRATAFADGLAEAGVAATFKHFPGFGAAAVNTDDAPARVELPLRTLRRVDLAPYRDLPDSVRLVMLSTAVYPALDPRPAAFSRRWATGELRDRLGFTGVSITDDLMTPAVERYGSHAQLAYFAASAGVDLRCSPSRSRAGRRPTRGWSPRRGRAGSTRARSRRARDGSWRCARLWASEWRSVPSGLGRGPGLVGGEGSERGRRPGGAAPNRALVTHVLRVVAACREQLGARHA